MFTNLKTLLLTGALITGSFSGANASTIIVDYNPDVVIESGDFEFLDVNDDGFGDVYGQISQFSGDARVGGGFADFADPGSSTGFTATQGEVLQDASGNAILLGEDVEVDASIAGIVGGLWSSASALLYSGADPDDGPLGGVGTQGFVGVRMSIFEAFGNDGCGGCEGGDDPIFQGYQYGWLDVTHGSLIFSQAGYGNGLGVAATTPGGNPPPPPIPLPAGFPLLLAGLGAFAFVKRRKA